MDDRSETMEIVEQHGSFLLIRAGPRFAVVGPKVRRLFAGGRNIRTARLFDERLVHERGPAPPAGLGRSPRGFGCAAGSEIPMRQL